MSMRRLHGSGSVATLALLIAVGLGGCQKNKVTKSNYDQIQVGTTFAEATKLLGDNPEPGPTRVIGELHGGRPKTAQTYRWKNGGTDIELEFADGKVTKKSATGL